jgi:hypothetical protein
MRQSLYDTDVYAWTQTPATALRRRDWTALDVEPLAEEIESLGRRDRPAIVSQLTRVLHHSLKWRYDPSPEPRCGWQLTLLPARQELAEPLAESPTPGRDRDRLAHGGVPICLSLVHRAGAGRVFHPGGRDRGKPSPS